MSALGAHEQPAKKLRSLPTSTCRSAGKRQWGQPSRAAEPAGDNAVGSASHPPPGDMLKSSLPMPQTLTLLGFFLQLQLVKSRRDRAGLRGPFIQGAWFPSQERKGVWESEMQGEGRGRCSGDAATSQGTPRAAGNHSSWERQGRVLSYRCQREHSPADTPISGL